MRLLFPAALLLAAAGSALAFPAVDEDLVPGGTVQSTLLPGSEVETYRVYAPAGSILSVDLRVPRGSALLPTLEADLPGGGDTAGLLRTAASGRRVRALLPFDADGSITLRVASADGVPGDYLLKTRLRAPPARTALGEVSSPGGTADVPLYAAANSLTTVRVIGLGASSVVPRIVSLAGTAGPALPAAVKDGATSSLWKKALLSDAGPGTLTVGGEGNTAGEFLAMFSFKCLRGPNEDHRVVLDPAALDGSYAAYLAAAPTLAFPAGALLTGRVAFDGRGGITTALGTVLLVPDAGSPLGFTFQQSPLPPGGGSYVTDGAIAEVLLDMGAGQTLPLALLLSSDASILYQDPAAGGATTGFLAKDGGPVTAATLAGTWAYASLTSAGDGTGSIEIGTLSLASTGTAAGLGARTSLTTDVDGNIVPGAATPLLRGGSFAVGTDGTVTFSTVENLFGPSSTWTTSPALQNDMLLGLDAAGGAGQLLLRQGTGLTNGDVTGEYLHFGLGTGAGGAATLRNGVLAMDGAGGFSGTETVTAFPAGTPETGVATTGTYSVNAQGIASFSLDGGAAGTGVVGPEARYMMAIALGAGGLGVDLLLRL